MTTLKIVACRVVEARKAMVSTDPAEAHSMRESFSASGGAILAWLTQERGSAPSFRFLRAPSDSLRCRTDGGFSRRTSEDSSTERRTVGERREQERTLAREDAASKKELERVRSWSLLSSEKMAVETMNELTSAPRIFHPVFLNPNADVRRICMMPVRERHLRRRAPSRPISRERTPSAEPSLPAAPRDAAAPHPPHPRSIRLAAGSYRRRSRERHSFSDRSQSVTSSQSRARPFVRSARFGVPSDWLAPAPEQALKLARSLPTTPKRSWDPSEPSDEGEHVPLLLRGLKGARPQFQPVVCRW